MTAPIKSRPKKQDDIPEMISLGDAALLALARIRQKMDEKK